jgi:hypothetical protein
MQVPAEAAFSLYSSKHPPGIVYRCGTRHVKLE